MTEVVLVVEDDGVLQLFDCPGDAGWVGETVLRAGHNGEWEVEKREIVIWWSDLTVFIKVFLGCSHVKSLESIWTVLQALTIVCVVFIAST